MNNIPNVHEHDKEIPAGKVLVAEYRDITESDRRVEWTTLDTKTGWNRVTVKLMALSAGWTIAGSMMRWDNGCFAVQWEMDGATHGRRYRDFESALAHFNRIPERDPYETAA